MRATQPVKLKQGAHNLGHLAALLPRAKRGTSYAVTGQFEPGQTVATIAIANNSARGGPAPRPIPDIVIKSGSIGRLNMVKFRNSIKSTQTPKCVVDFAFFSRS